VCLNFGVCGGNIWFILSLLRSDGKEGEGLLSSKWLVDRCFCAYYVEG
jgi:hypothetical protein